MEMRNTAPNTLIELLCWRAQSQSDQLLYTFLDEDNGEGSSLSYSMLDVAARAIAVQLRRYITSQQRILLLFPPGLDYIAAFFGCLYAGGVAVPTFPPAPTRMSRRIASRLGAIVADAQPAIVLTSPQILAHVEQLFAHEPQLQTLRWLAPDWHATQQATEWQSPTISGDTLAFLQYTSGSSGSPKGVMLSHTNLLHNSALIHRAFGHSQQSRGVIWLPPYHDMGLIGGILQFLYGGFPVTFMTPTAFIQRPLRWLQAISETRATTSGGPNFAYELCVQRITPEQCEGLDLSCWQVAFNGAEPIRHTTLERFTETFAPYGFRREAWYPCYGLAEATLMVSGGSPTTPPSVRTFDGDALEHHWVELADQRRCWRSIS